jgi:hypothetical protein
MGFDRHREPPHELPAATRMCASRGGEVEAIDWYQQRLAFESDTFAVHTA